MVLAGEGGWDGDPPVLLLVLIQVWDHYTNSWQVAENSSLHHTSENLINSVRIITIHRFGSRLDYLWIANYTEIFVRYRKYF